MAGVFAFCTWESDAAFIGDVPNERDTARAGAGVGKRILRYAARHNLAVVSWTTFGSDKAGFDKTRSFDELSNLEASKFGRVFDRVSRTGRRGWRI